MKLSRIIKQAATQQYAESAPGSQAGGHRSYESQHPKLSRNRSVLNPLPYL
jgi:hypothetical protein